VSDSAAPLILVTGATGAVGPAVVRAAAAGGYRVRTLSRHPPEPGLFPEGVDVRIGDVCDPSAIRAALSGTTGVLHLAALLHLLNGAGQRAPEYARINADATASLAREAARAGVQRVVLFSTIAVYGSRGGAVVSEDTAPRPDTEYARTKRRAEEALLGEVASDGAPSGVVLRLAAVYGARVRGNYRTLVDLLERRRFVPVGPGLNRRTLVYEDDVARAALIALEHPAAPGRVFNVTDGTTHTVRDVIAAICRALGRTPPRLHVPLAPVRAAASIAGPMLTLAGRGRSLDAMIAKYTEDVAVDGTRIQRELGYRPAIGLDEGWKKAVAGLTSTIRRQRDRR